MSEQVVYALIACGIMLLVGFPVHEFMHAYAAYRLGDSTARYRGRLTLNPVVHFDQVGGIMLLLSAVLTNGSAFFGFAKPTPVNPLNLSGGRRGEAMVAAAGPVSNLIMAAVVAIPLRIILNDPTWMGLAGSQGGVAVVNITYSFVLINVFLFIFNLIPVPPLDGWHVLTGLVPSRNAWQLRQFEMQYGQMLPVIALLVIILFGGRIIGPIADFIMRMLLGTG